MGSQVDVVIDRGSARFHAWMVFVAMVIFIATTLGLAFDVSSFLRARGYLWPTVQSMFAIAGSCFVYLLVFGAGLNRPLPYLRAVLPLGLYLYAMLEMRKSPAERFHFLEYGVLYVLALRAISIDLPNPLAYALAILPTGLAGWFDEYLQGMTPKRYFDWGDVRMNFAAVALAALVCFSLFGRDPRLSRFPHLPRPTN